MVVSGSLQHHHIIISSPSYSSFSLNSLHFAIQSFKSIYPKLELCIVSSSISRNIPIEEEGSKEGETLSSSLSSPHQGPDENLTHHYPYPHTPPPSYIHTTPYLTLPCLSTYVHIVRTRTSPRTCPLISRRSLSPIVHLSPIPSNLDLFPLSLSLCFG